MPPAIDALDLRDVPPAIGLPLLAQALRASAALSGFTTIGDLSCEVLIDAKNGRCHLSFRACR